MMRLGMPTIEITPNTESSHRMMSTVAISAKGPGKRLINHTTSTKIKRSHNVI